MINELYPLKFKPVFHQKIWGGSKIRTSLGLDYTPLPNCGEAWILSGVEENQSLVENGFLAGNKLNELVEIYMGDLIGEQVYQVFGNEFPLLIKILDTNQWLSIQVHPDDELAQERHQSMGKTEMWYVLEAEEGAELIAGFNKKLNKESYRKILDEKKLPSVMNFEQVSAGDVFYIPSGRVHALGPGILLVEIQQTSDITYRMYDWDRIGIDGTMRALHTDLAVEAIDFEMQENYRTDYEINKNQTTPVIQSPYFNTNIISLDQPLRKDYEELDSFVIYVCVEGSFQLNSDRNSILVNRGEAILIPAFTRYTELLPLGYATILEVFLLIN